MVSSSLTVDVEQASFNTFILPGTWQALIICGQHIRQHTHAVQGMETDRCTTDCVWNAKMTLELQQNEEVKHLEIWLFRNQEYMCTAMVPLQENTGKSQWYKLETSPGESCGHVKLMFTWAPQVQGPQVQGPQIRPKGDGTYTRPSYNSGMVFSDHVPRQHGTHVYNGGPVPTPGPDRNGGYQQPPQGYGAHPGYQPQTQHQQRESYTSQQQVHAYPPQQSTHGQYSQDYWNGGVAPSHANHAHGGNTHTQYAGGNGYVSSYSSAAPAAGYGSSPYQHTTPGRSQFDDDELSGYYRRHNH
ncbi:hypothetical protein BDL97_03G121000 [Sphagnum fallax]|nr:hypothetical protein BDL97_03G121000 [Sphagnum fallax]